MDLLEQMPPVVDEMRERGYRDERDLVGGLDDPDALVRRGCVELLAEAWPARSPGTAGRVARMLADPAWQVRYAAAHALSQEVAGPELLPTAIATLHRDDNRYVRMVAVELVGTAVGSNGVAAQALRDVRDGDADPAVRRKAARYAPGGANAVSRSAGPTD